MAKKRKILIIMGITCILSFSIVYAKVQNNGKYNLNDSNTLSKYQNISENDITKKLNILNKHELIKELNLVTKDLKMLQGSYASSELIPFANELFNRKDNFNNKEIINEIKNNNNTLETKMIMVDLNTVKNEDNLISNEMKALLGDNIDISIKQKIITDSVFSDNDKDMLKELYLKNNDDIAFQSLKQLKKISPLEAYNISKNVLKTSNNSSYLEVSGAQKAAANYFKLSKNNKMITKEKYDFIDKCVNIIKDKDKSYLKDSSIFALSEMNDKDALFILINNKDIDDIVKTYCIDENFNIIEEILNHNPTDDDINTILDAMNINPILESVKPLNSIINNIKNIELKEKVRKTVDFINQNGVNATKFN